ncbi:MAG TPA: N-acetylglucosamine/diacetylchitobiose ABC transporter substrate-binding protein [Natronosporangium sp.]
MSRSQQRRSIPTGGSRRRFLKQLGASGVLLGPGSGLLAACATGGGDDDDDDRQTGEVTEQNPFGMPEDGEIEIWIFDGGFTDRYAVELHQPILKQRWPNVQIDHHAAVDIGAELQARFVAGDPPDFVNNSGDGQMDTAQLVADGQLHDLSALFDAPSWDDPSVKVRDTLVPGTIELGTFDGTPYVLNYAFTVFGLWYNKTLFDEHGWTPPRTWDEMLALCAEIQSAGIAPWTYQGVTAPRYMNWPLLTMAAKQAGPQILVPIDNLEEGAWKQDAILQSAEAIYRLAENGYFMEGTEGMEFRDAQAAWARGEAAIIPSGSWLENEEADAIAEDPTFEMAYMLEPLLTEDAVMPYETLRATPGEPYFIPADAKNPAGGMEYMRAMLSKEGARGFTEMVSSLTSVLGAADDVELDAPGLNSAKQAFSAAGENVINWFYPTWYPTMENPGIDQATGKLLKADINPEQWAEECEAVTRQIREDDSIPKQTRS